MALETGSYIGNLVATNPTGADAKSQGDDHLRLIKTALLNCFAGFTGSVMVTGTDGGAANAYTVTPATAVPGYVSRMLVVFAPTVTNTGASTINISGLGVKDIKSVSGAALAANDLVLGIIYVAVYNGTEFRLLSTTKNYVDQLAFNTALPAQPGGTARYELNSVGGSATWGLSNQLNVRAITGASTVTIADAGNLVDITSGTFTLAFDAVATLGDNTSGFIRNSGTGEVTLDPSGAETIDGLTSFVMYANEVRRWYVDGSAIKTLVLKPFYINRTSSFTYIHPPGYSLIDTDLVGAGGGGGSGRRGAAGSTTGGGAPGGAAARVLKHHYGIAAGTSISVTVGAAGTGGAAQTVDSTDGVAGTSGGNTSFGTLSTAFGGVGGRAGFAGDASTSGSGSVSIGTTGGGGQSGGHPRGTYWGGTNSASGLFGDNVLEGGGGSAATSAFVGGNTYYGGAGSGIDNSAGTTVNDNAGSSVYGVCAGSAGGWITSANTMPATASRAGSRGSYTAGGGALGGTCGASPTAGTAGSAATNDSECGTSGAGGGSSATAAAAAGGAGGAPGGAGGGGGASRNGFNSGAGAAGAAGRAIISGVA